ncbi:MAG: carboxypeptidase regulatory-like domain-containing protein [Treponema sp.]|nr:carboxypeptidase regulatory-like domain-containing protein [Treponema sp.]
MQKTLIVLVHCLIATILLTSCASTKFEGTAVLAGRVYDTHGKPVPNYHVSLGPGVNAITDSGGIFTFKNLPSKTYTISGGANGWCALEQEFFFHDKKEMLCLEVEKLEDTIPVLEQLVCEEDFDGAEKLLETVKNYNEKNPLYLSMKKLIEYCKVPSEKRKEKFLSALEKI